MPPTQTAVRPAYRPYAAEVARVRRLTPHFIRVTFTAAEFEHFGTRTARSAHQDRAAASGWNVLRVRAGRTAPATGTSGGARCRRRSGTRSAPTPSGASTRSCASSTSTSSCTTTRVRPARGRSSAAAGQRLVIVGPDARSPHSGGRSGLASGHGPAGPARGRRDGGPGDPLDPRAASAPTSTSTRSSRFRRRPMSLPVACHDAVPTSGGSRATSGRTDSALIEALTDWTGTNLDVLASRRRAAPPGDRRHRRRPRTAVGQPRGRRRRVLRLDRRRGGDRQDAAPPAGEPARCRPQARRLHGLLAAGSGGTNRMSSAARTRRARVVLACVIVLLAGAVVLSLGVGARAIAPSSVLQALFARLSPATTITRSS